MNRKLWIALIAAALLVMCALAGCSGDTSPDEPNSASKDLSDAQSVLQNESGAASKLASDTSVSAASDIESDIASNITGDVVSGDLTSDGSSDREVGAASNIVSNGASDDTSVETVSSAESKPTEQSAPSEISKPSETSKPAETSKPTESSKPAETSKPSETSKPNPPEESSAPNPENPGEPSQPAEPEYGTDAWCRAVEERVVYWINVYRAEEGKGELKVLPRMSEYARQRAPQLEGNVTHDPKYMAEAATAIRYGVPIDELSPTIIQGAHLEDLVGKGLYYPYGVGEAVGRMGHSDLSGIDGAAQGFANAVRASKAHWAYVGDTAYDDPELEHKWIGIGVYRGYICICVAVDIVLPYESN